MNNEPARQRPPYVRSEMSKRTESYRRASQMAPGPAREAAFAAHFASLPPMRTAPACKMR